VTRRDSAASLREWLASEERARRASDLYDRVFGSFHEVRHDATPPLVAHERFVSGVAVDLTARHDFHAAVLLTSSGYDLNFGSLLDSAWLSERRRVNQARREARCSPRWCRAPAERSRGEGRIEKLSPGIADDYSVPHRAKWIVYTSPELADVLWPHWIQGQPFVLRSGEKLPAIAPRGPGQEARWHP
jgi:hypothetical protein